MPNRILRESICTSDTIDKLSWFEEALYYRLIVTCDDFGRFDGRTAVIKNRLFPLKDGLTLKTVETALHGLANAGLVSFYTVEGRRFLCLPTWGKYQTQRAKVSKYPAPDTSDESDEQSSAIICKQMQADDSKCSRIRESNSLFAIRDTGIENIGTEPQAASMPPVIFLPLNDGTEYPVSQEQCHEWAGLYPAVDVIQQLRQMRAWLIANPRKKKTKSGINRFIVTWLSKEQDRGGVYGKEESRGQQGKPEYRNVGRDL
nr:MAG TPA: replisome organizer [Caudoviricetes sp.]